MLRHDKPLTHFKNIDRILIVAPAWLGDAVISHSLIRHLSREYKTASIDVFVSRSLQPIYKQMPEVNEIIDNQFGHGQLRLYDRWRTAKTIKSNRYDVVYVLPNSIKSALVPFLARIPHRVGYTGELRFGLLNHRQVLNKTQYPLLVDQYLQLARDTQSNALALRENPKLSVTSEDFEQTLMKFNINNRIPYVCLCPGAEYGPAKRWPQQHYAELAQELRAHHLPSIILGSNHDIDIGAAIHQLSHESTQNLTGMTSLEEAVHIISGAKCVITNDSGLMHVAAALNTPLIALFGSSSPTYTPPLSDNAKILIHSLACSPCFQRICPLGHTKCLTDIKTNSVLTEVLALVKKN
ncbi:MAG: lipopolysaccharide heptosyltransferase II [Proteobacteria bacterium]|nr:lipopolysaccharide heptosyltransferase II [Pseudomonadota bacterium]MDA1331362.1 lipopolysaccharide heptosyltransferase II [Pseudomonadota bacterium]